MSFEKRLTQKLYEPRSIEGDAQNETFEAVRFFEERLKGLEGFVGIDPHGSTTKGYGNEDSDIDLRVRVDVGQVEFLGDNEELFEREEKFRQLLAELAEELQQKIGTKVHTSIFSISNEANTERLKERLNGYEKDAFVVGSIFRAINGDEIEKYRDNVIDILKQLELDERERLVEKMAEALTEDEWLSFHKVKDRSAEEIDASEFMKKRQEMWKKRILGFLEID